MDQVNQLQQQNTLLQRIIDLIASNDSSTGLAQLVSNINRTNLDGKRLHSMTTLG
ncbi:hypothetical protein OKN36_20040 [Furfurilactobacillus sp. OKN36]